MCDFLMKIALFSLLIEASLTPHCIDAESAQIALRSLANLAILQIISVQNLSGAERAKRA